VNVTELEGLIADAVQAALEQPDHSMRMTELRDAAATAFAVAYEDAGGPQETYESAEAAFLNTLNAAAAHTFPDGTDAQAERITHILATAASNGAVVAAAPGEQFEWITMLDDAVREDHRPLHGEVRAAGTPFIVAGVPLMYPGQPVGPPEVWINCRCTLRASLTAAAEAPVHTGIAMVARPRRPETLVAEGGLPADELHVTLGFFGNTDDPDLDPTLRGALEKYLTDAPLIPHRATVGGMAYLGDDDPQACVMLVESDMLGMARDELEAVATPDLTHPHFTPHMTLGYGMAMPATHPTTVDLDHAELWWGGERIAGPSLLGPDDDVEWSDESLEACACQDDELTARAFDTEQRKAMAKRHTAMPDGSYPIANAEDLRNAIQAIGRAKDPAKVKAHIRRRAKALGLTELIPESWTASIESENDSVVAAPGTHDGPGWLTHPRDTQRLRDYWTRGKGAAKIRWGSPGDLTRCHKHLQKYVGPFAWGTCQNLHKTALGIYNPESRGNRNRRADGAPQEDAMTATMTTAVANGGHNHSFNGDPVSHTHGITLNGLTASTLPGPPLEWFENPGFDAATPLTITADGRVLGHLASWDTCHVGITGECVKPPHSQTAYAYFRTGEIETREGTLVATGKITMDTGHAGKDDGPAASVAHYDNTGTAVADVAAGEDDYGIWIAGALRPNIGEQKMYDLRATGALSGDWRRIGGNLELVAALAVNVPGFPVPRVEMSASAGRPTSLTAAAVVGIDPNAGDPERVAIAVIARLDQRDAEAKRRVRAAALAHQINTLRAEALTAGVR
jgi:2'-5' RNA ligase